MDEVEADIHLTSNFLWIRKEMLRFEKTLLQILPLHFKWNIL